MDDAKMNFKKNCDSIRNSRKVSIKKKNFKKGEYNKYVELIWQQFLICNQSKNTLLDAIGKYFEIFKISRVTVMKTVPTLINLDFMSEKNVKFQTESFDFNDLLNSYKCDLDSYNGVIQSVIENGNLLSVISEWVCVRSLKDKWTFNDKVECNDELLNIGRHLIEKLNWNVKQIEFNNNNQPIVGMIPLKYSDLLKYWKNHDILIHTQLMKWCEENKNYTLFDQIIDSCDIKMNKKTNNPYYRMQECVTFMNKVQQILTNNQIKDINQFLNKYLQIYNQFSFLKSQHWIDFLDWYLKHHNVSIYVLGSPSIFNDIVKLKNLINKDITDNKYIKIRFIPFIPTMIGESIYELLQNDMLVNVNSTKFNKGWELCLNFLKSKYNNEEWTDKSRGMYLSDKNLIRKHVTFKTAFQSLMMNHLVLFKEIKWIKVMLFYVSFYRFAKYWLCFFV